MNEPELRALIEDVRTGALPRRGFIQQHGRPRPDRADGLDDADARRHRPGRSRRRSTSRPSAAAAAPLKVLWWQGATLLKPHFAIGTKDQEGSRIFYEPLAAWDTDGNLVPILAAEIPTRAERRPARPTARSVTWKLKKGVTWHDGQPFTADDVRLQLGVRRATRPPPRSRSASTRTSRSRRSTTTRSASSFEQADAVLGRRLRRRRGHDHPEAPVRAVHRRQVARRAEQPEAGRHRPVQVRRLQAGRHGRAARSTRTTTCRTGPSSTRSR